MTKNEFINLVAAEFLSHHGAWRSIYENRREYRLAIGREVNSECLVFLDLSARPDRYWFGHGVGWCPSVAYYQEWQQRRVNPPTYRRSGSLRKLQTLESPLDFQNSEMRLATFQLHKPMAQYDLEKTPAEELKAEMLGEMDAFALPYLCMMLRARHGLETTQEELAKGPRVGKPG